MRTCPSISTNIHDAGSSRTPLPLFFLTLDRPRNIRCQPALWHILSRRRSAWLRPHFPLLQPRAIESWVTTVKTPQNLLPDSHPGSVGNSLPPSTHFQNHRPLLHPKPVSVRAPASILSIERRSISSYFRSFRVPRRAHPFHSILHLPRTAAHRLPCTVPWTVLYADQRRSSPAGAVSTTVEHDVQGDAIAIAAMDMGSH